MCLLVNQENRRDLAQIGQSCLLPALDALGADVFLFGS